MKSKNIDLNSAVITLGVVLLAVGLILNYFWLAPQLKNSRIKNQSAQAQLNADNQDLDTLNKIADRLNQAQGDLQSRGVNIDQLKSIYPSTEDLPGLYVQMERIVGQLPQLNMTYSVGKPEQAPLNTSATSSAGVRIPLSINATGSYADLRKLLSLLTTNLRPIEISNLSVSLATTKNTNTPTPTPTPSAPPTPASNNLSITITGFAKAAGLSSAYSSTPSN